MLIREAFQHPNTMKLNQLRIIFANQVHGLLKLVLHPWTCNEAMGDDGFEDGLPGARISKKFWLTLKRKCRFQSPDSSAAEMSMWGQKERLVEPDLSLTSVSAMPGKLWG